MSDAIKGVPVNEESVCRHFERTPTSLIEEPEVCEWCVYYKAGLCTRAE